MISLILPYWDRQEAADKALALISFQYRDLLASKELELVIVDDGNPVPFKVPDSIAWANPTVIRLPEKQIPKSPVTAWNAGVHGSKGDLVVLSCIEVLHEKPVLQEMASQVRNMGEYGYVLAATWCPEDGNWHCHSAVKTPRNPAGTGITFCAMMHRELFEKAGGFDEEYRDGAGYEDNDFINRMLVAGARFVIRDDLVVTHPKTGATTQWVAGGFERNERLYYSKWPTELRLNSVTFCCVNAGDYLGRGREYVIKLNNMLRCCLPDGTAYKFVCFTDDPFEHEGIECRPLPITGLQGWHNKIALFSPGVFEEGERIAYFDLDTLLIGRIDSLIGYQGEFAVLRDFWRPEGLGPAVMLWRGGSCEWIWTEYEKAGRPELAQGDQEWLERIFAERGYKPSILQDVFLELFCSFKGDCRPNPPANARIVCFHGLPRPHDVPGWVQDVWNGKATGSSLEMICNVALGQIVRNIKSSSARSIPTLQQLPAHDKKAVLVGGGPSMLDEFDKIRALQAEGATIFAMNGTADFLKERGITPDIQIAIDARPENLRFVKNRSAKQYYVASQCDPCIFDYLDNPTLFHVALVDWDKYLPDSGPAMAIGGGHSVGLYAMSLAYVLGYRDMHLFGYDSSYRDDSHHAYEQKSNDDDSIIEAFVNGRTFKTTSWMVVQVNEFKDLSYQLSQMGCVVTTHGNGLLPYVAWQMAALAKAA